MDSITLTLRNGASNANALIRRDEAETQAFLELLKAPFSDQLVTTSLWASLGTSVGFTILIAVLFSILRPYNSVVYAPKLKHADDKHAPPPMGKGFFAWVKPVMSTKEQDLINGIGLDATIFLRFARMLRNMFMCITIVGCGILIPINLAKGTPANNGDNTSYLSLLSPLQTYGEANWGQVVCAWVFDIIIAGFLWWNYKKVLALRRQYFTSPEYQKSLHARTLMINDIPKEFRTDEGISRLIDMVVPDSSFSRTAIARNVKELPELIEEHDKTVRQLEEHLAKYLKNPDTLPASRPECKPSKKDPSWGSYPKGQKVDAIEYLTGRINELEIEIKEVRLSIDKRNALSYGFASFEDIAEAHSIAYAARKKHPHGTTIVLAPRPNDVIWKNMPLDKSSRRSKNILNNFWITLLTFAWVAPNIMISIFLINLQNLGRVWHAFNVSLGNHTTWWAIVQGVASPALTSLIYLLLPIMFRRMAIRAGDRSKTARERHVMSKLFFFFVFNNLIVFSLFSTIWNFVAAVVSDTSSGTDAWTAIKAANFATALFISICGTSSFWVMWLLQRNLGAAVDIAQLWTLFWSSCVRKFSSPTPRELIELTAPPAFDYATYYNYFLFYATVAICLATLQPLVIPAAAVYFIVDVYFKKYLIIYIFITKTESGGMFWRTVFNRMVFAAILGNLVVFLAVWGIHGDGAHMQAYCIAPLPFLMIAFKVYCSKAFDDKIHYYTTRNMLKDPEHDAASNLASKKSDRLASRYGHPALYRPLITPMVHARAQNILASIYRGRLTNSNTADSTDMQSVSGYSDTFALDSMRPGAPGQTEKKSAMPGFEVVPESHLDFGYYKNRAEFGDEHGGGDIYSRPTDMIDRPGTSNTFRGGYSTPGSSRAGSPAPMMHGGRQVVTGGTELSGYSPAGYDGAAQGDIGALRHLGHGNGSEANIPLVQGAAEMPIGVSGPYARSQSLERRGSPAPYQSPTQERRAPGFLGGGPGGYGGLPQHEDDADPISYDYFRSRRQPNQGQ